MRYGSVCSGIEAASVAWEPLGFSPAWFAEIAEFPSAVLSHRFPNVTNHGSLVGLADRLAGDDRRIDLLVGGTPCQSFSVAGLRGGLSDDRGNLALEFMRLAQALRPRWVVWENVPGVLSSGGGRDFGSIIGALEELGYGWAYRVLDARHFGVPQRRRRVFLVGSLAGPGSAAAVLFEPEGMCGDPAKSGAAREDVAGTLGGGSPGRGWSSDTDRMTFVPEVAATLRGASRGKPNGTDRGTFVASNGEGADGFTLTRSNLSKHVNNQTPLLAFDPTQVTHPENRSTCSGDTTALAKSARPPHIAYAMFPGKPPEAEVRAMEIDCAPALTSTAEARSTDREVRIVQCVTGEVTHALRSVGADASEDGTGRGTPIVSVAPTLDRDMGKKLGNNQWVNAWGDVLDAQARAGWKVRRLTPVECERLQGFPDDWTAIPGAKDSPRYAALGNSMAVPVMRWIGARIALVDGLLNSLQEAA